MFLGFHLLIVREETLSPMKALLKLVSVVALLVALSTLPASAQHGDQAQAEDLQKQLQDLKRQYEATTHAMEQRIAALESQIQKQKQATEKAQQGTRNRERPQL